MYFICLIKVVQNINKMSETIILVKLGKIGKSGDFNCGLSTGRLQEDRQIRKTRFYYHNLENGPIYLSESRFDYNAM